MRKMFVVDFVFGIVCWFLGYSAAYICFREKEPTQHEVIVKEYWTSDTTYLDNGDLMILQHKKFKQVN